MQRTAISAYCACARNETGARETEMRWRERPVIMFYYIITWRVLIDERYLCTIYKRLPAGLLDYNLKVVRFANDHNPYVYSIILVSARTYLVPDLRRHNRGIESELYPLIARPDILLYIYRILGASARKRRARTSYFLMLHSPARVSWNKHSGIRIARPLGN